MGKQRDGPGITGRATIGPVIGPNFPRAGLVTMLLSVDTEYGTLATKRSLLYGGRHGRPPMIDMPLDEVVERLTRDLRSGVRAMQHRLERAREEGHG